MQSIKQRWREFFNLGKSDFPRLKGFTLIEILLYIAIFAIAAGLLVGVLNITTRVQNRETAAAEVSQQLEFVMQNIQRYVRESSNIDIPAGTATSTLKLRTKSSSTDPILIFTDASNTAIYIKQGTGASTTLTSNRVTVGNFNVTKYENPGGHATIQLDMTLNYNSAISPLFTNVSQSLSTAIARVSAATFDSDLIPNADNTFSVGQTLNRWKNAFFDKIAIGTTTITNLLTIQPSATGPIVVTTGGNVGIGTSAPANNLAVFGSGDTSIRIETTATGNAGASLRLKRNTTGATREWWVGNSQANDSFDIYDNTASAVRLTIASSGNVGIGTTNPTTLLNIISASNVLRFPSTDGGSIGLQLEANSAGHAPALYLKSTNTNGRSFRLASWNDSITGKFIIRDDSSGADRLTIDSSGNVGIGTTNPGAKLEVNTGATGYISKFVGSAGNFFVFNTTGSEYEIGTGGNAKLHFDTAATQRMTIDTNGNVGIGNISPTGLLHVSSSALYVSSTSGNVGIGTTTPGEKLHVSFGNLRLDSSADYIILNPSSGGNPLLQMFNSGEIDAQLTVTNAAGFNFNSRITSSGRIVATGGPLYTGVGIVANSANGIVEMRPSAGNPSFITWIEDSVAFRGSLGFLAGSGDLVYTSGGTGTLSSGTERLRITSIGNVGIGTSTPQSTLQVVGNYIQFPTISGAAPATTDCDAAAEAGRIVVRTDGTANLYICTGTGGWISK